MCFSLIDHQLKKGVIVLLCLQLVEKNAYSFSADLCKQVHENIMAFGGGLDSVFNFEKLYATVDVSNKRAFVNIVCVTC